MTEKLSYEALEAKLSKLEAELGTQKEIEKALEKERYYLEQAQEIGGMGTWEVDLDLFDASPGSRG